MSRSGLACCILATVILAELVGCGTSPTVPPGSGLESIGSLPRTESSSHRCIGFYALTLDLAQGGIQVVPMRSADLHLNMVGVLNGTMGVSAVPVPSDADPAHGLFAFDVTLEHPFAIKPQLAGFDVKGILMTPGSLAFGPFLVADADETRLENADGFTRWWNPTEFTLPGMFGYTQGTLASTPPAMLTATVNPYKLFADILAPTDGLSWVAGEPLDSPEGRAVFTAGSSNTRRYRIRFPMNPGPVVRFGYAVDASWAAPTPNPPAEVPDDFPINANMPEAWRVTLLPVANTLYYDTESGIGGGVLRLEISVYDWQGQSAGNVQGEVSEVRLFAPDLMSGGVSAVFSSESGIKASYTAELTGPALPTHAGPVQLMCRVGSTDGSAYKQTAAPAPDSTLSAFQVITLDIPDPDCVGDANNDWSEAIDIEMDESVAGQLCLPDDYRDYYRFAVPAGFDLTGSIALYCDATPTTIGVYDTGLELIQEAAVSGGSASIPVNDLPLYPGQYYIRIYTSNSTQVAPYYLDMGVAQTDVTPDNPVEVTPDTLFCSASNAWRYGDYLIQFGFYGVWVHDVTDPSQPDLIGFRLMDGSWTAALQYPYLYYVRHENDYDLLGLVDLSDLGNIAVHENLIDFGEHVSDIAMNSENLYVAMEANSTEDLRIYEWSANPESPTLAGTGNIDPCDGIALIDPEGSQTRLLAWIDAIVYTYDIEDPGSVAFLGVAFLDGKARDGAVNGSRIYILSDDVGKGVLAVLTNTASGPLFKSALDISDNPHCLGVQGNHVFASNTDFYEIVDVSDINAPVFVDSVPMHGAGICMVADSSTLYSVVYEGGFDVYDIAFPPTPDLVYHAPVVNRGRDAAVVGDYLFVADTNWDTLNAVKAVHILDPAGAHVESELFPTGILFNIAAGDGFILVNVNLSNLLVIDVTDPTDLSIIDSITVSDNAAGIAVHENTLYIGTGAATLVVYDITDPSSAVYKTTKTASANLVGLAFWGDYMYAADSDDVIEVFSIANPYNPAPVGSYTPTDTIGEIAVVGDYLHICGEGVFEVADLSDPAAPSYIGSVSLPPSNWYQNMATDGHFAYLCGHQYGGAVPTVCSGWPPDSPSIVHSFDPWVYNMNYDIQTDNGFLYLLSLNGIRIYDLY